MAQIQIPEKLTVENMPDDPRECCRWILEAGRDDVNEFPLNTAPAALCDLVEMMDVALHADSGLEEIAALARNPLTVLAYLAKDVIREWEKELRSMRTIARHGIGDWREIDRDDLARQRLREVGDTSHRRPNVERVGTDIAGVSIMTDPALEASEVLSDAEKVLDASYDDDGNVTISVEDREEKLQAYRKALREFIASEANTLPGLIAKIRWLDKSLQTDGDEYDARLAHSLVYDARRIWRAEES